MNDLQKLLKLRGISVRQMSTDIGEDYTCVQKIICRTPYYVRKTGEVLIRKTPRIRAKIANYLGLTHDEAWGKRSSLALRQAILVEIRKQAKAREKELADKYLNTSSSLPERRLVCNA
jgi:lambda repressor-like predicted transcriptional regulator